MSKYDFYNAIERHARKFIGEKNIVSNPLLDGNRIMRERISYDVEIDTSGLKEAKELFALIDKYFKWNKSRDNFPAFRHCS